MSKKSNLGRSLIKNRFSNTNKKLNHENFLHTSELKDGYDWNKINLQSVTEQNSFEEFLSTAELAGTEFVAEKLNVSFVTYNQTGGLLSNDEEKRTKKLHEDNKKLLKIPRRPNWNKDTTADKLQAEERQLFLEWRRELTLFQENSGLIITPYEKNLDFWRQLWRVVERSDVIVQIVDARNPLLFRSEDLELYVKEVDKSKQNLILCNKADFLTKKQRYTWARYFDSIGTKIVFFSATRTLDIIEESDDDNQEAVLSSDGHLENSDNETRDVSSDNDSDYTTEEEEEITEESDECKVTYEERIRNSSKLLSREELIEHFRRYKINFPEKEIVTIGLVGYPNVGKSSTINSLLTFKKVPVSSTPGKTKHFQTLYLDNDILLCDCPGLVMPSFVLTKADMILNGILPIDQMRDHVSAVNLLCSFIPRYVLEEKYGINVPKPEEGEDPNRPLNSEELLNTYAFSRGFMTANGQPDNSRAARYVLKDFVNGKLLYCYAPPNFEQAKYHIFPESDQKPSSIITPQMMRAVKAHKVSLNDVNRHFFKQRGDSTIHVKESERSVLWKNHKEKRNKHVKSRVKYRHLDE